MDTTNSAEVDRDGIADRLEEFVRRTGEVTDDDLEFGRDVHIFEHGYLDSLGVVRLIEFLESTYSIAFTDEELFDPVFTTIDGIVGIMVAHLGRAGRTVTAG